MSALKSHRQAYYQLQHAMNQREVDYNHMSGFHAIAMAKKSNTTAIDGGDPDHMDTETGLSEVTDSDYGSRQFAESWADAARQAIDGQSEISDFPSSLGTAERFFNDGRSDPMEVEPASNGNELRPEASDRLQTVSNPNSRQLMERIDLSAIRRENQGRMQANEARTRRQSNFDRNRRHRDDINEVQGNPLEDARRDYRQGMSQRTAEAIRRQQNRQRIPVFGRSGRRTEKRQQDRQGGRFPKRSRDFDDRRQYADQ